MIPYCRSLLYIWSRLCIPIRSVRCMYKCASLKPTLGWVMTRDAEVAGPIADVRDVVESFRGYGLKSTDWRDPLRAALDRLPRTAPLGQAWNPGELAAALEAVLEVGLTPGPALDRLSELLIDFLDEVEIEGLPKPSDSDWTFEGLSAS
jgi:hypothetical protein